MLPFETERVEFKSVVSDKALKEIIAFANTSSGTIYFGVADDGAIIGLDNVDEQCAKLTNMIRDGIRPDITLFTSVSILSENNLAYIKVEVSIGSNRPYYLRSKGLRPEGVYIRQGSSSAPASMEYIRSMIRETDGIKYEKLRSLNQNLTFTYASQIFSNAGIPFGEPQFITLGIKTEEDLFTNLGLLLSDQCPHLIKAAAFRGTTRVNFKLRKELTGSVLKQAEDAVDFVMLGLPTLTTFPGIRRVDSYVVNPLAVKEGIYNALVHREYSIDGPTMLSMFDDRIEILSVGGLPFSATTTKLLYGISICRNKALAEIFYRLRLIEAYGTGLPRIADTYADSIVKHSLEISENAFKITLPYKPEVLRGINEQENLVKQKEAHKTTQFNEFI